MPQGSSTTGSPPEHGDGAETAERRHHRTQKNQGNSQAKKLKRDSKKTTDTDRAQKHPGGGTSWATGRDKERQPKGRTYNRRGGHPRKGTSQAGVKGIKAIRAREKQRGNLKTPRKKTRHQSALKGTPPETEEERLGNQMLLRSALLSWIVTGSGPHSSMEEIFLTAVTHVLSSGSEYAMLCAHGTTAYRLPGAHATRSRVRSVMALCLQRADGAIFAGLAFAAFVPFLPPAPAVSS